MSALRRLGAMSCKLALVAAPVQPTTQQGRVFQSLERGGVVSLSEKLAAPPAPVTRKDDLTAWVSNLPPKDRAAVETALADPAWRHKDLQAVLTDEGMPKIADTTFGQWRRDNWLNR